MKSNFFTRRLLRYAEETWLPPFPQALPSSVDVYVQSISVWKVARRRAMRALNLRLHGQTAQLRTHIDPAVHRRLLWIHHGTPQVGDSLTDLAARELLKGKFDRVDLLTDAHLLQLYRSDEVFTQVASKAEELPGPYDLILLHSASSRSVKDKLEHYRKVPFAHVYGFYTGPELNRTLFGYYRIAQLLGLDWPEQQIEHMACPSMRASAAEEVAVDQLGLPPEPIVMAIGGVRDWCTYQQWPQVLHGLHEAGVTRPVVLVGSDNGLAMRDQIVAANTGMTLIDRLAQHTLGEVQALMRRAALVVCADGGLLHLAHTAKVPVVTLFAGISEPRFRLTSANRTRWLYGAKWVNDVQAADLVATILQALGSKP
ncbi:MAG TPA: glycosyltransferase family 9 protein [Rhizobacter sp.]|nr:glycosyltransferase family 9 protein [Rhizobacter sp.]